VRQLPPVSTARSPPCHFFVSPSPAGRSPTACSKHQATPASHRALFHRILSPGRAQTCTSAPAPRRAAALSHRGRRHRHRCRSRAGSRELDGGAGAPRAADAQPLPSAGPGLGLPSGGGGQLAAGDLHGSAAEGGCAGVLRGHRVIRQRAVLPPRSHAHAAVPPHLLRGLPRRAQPPQHPAPRQAVLPVLVRRCCCNPLRWGCASGAGQTGGRRPPQIPVLLAGWPADAFGCVGAYAAANRKTCS